MTTRVSVHYGDRVYTIADRSGEQVRREIETMLGANTPGWLDVNYGEGRPTPAQLLVTSGVALVIQEESAPDLP